MRYMLLALFLCLPGLAHAQGGKCGANNPNACPNPIYSALGIGAASPSAGSGTVAQSATATAPLTANNNDVFMSVFSSDYQTTPVFFQQQLDVIMNDNGDSSGNGTGVFSTTGRFTANANSTDSNSGNSTPNAAWDMGIDVPCIKNNPTGGLPVGASLKNCYANWSPSHDRANNEYASMDGVFANGEWDLYINGLDDWDNRPMNQYIAFNEKQVTGGGAGWPASLSSMFYLQAAGDVYAGDAMEFDTSFSNAVLDLVEANSATSTITSPTPGMGVNSVTVNNILPLTAGNNVYFGLGHNGDTAAKTKNVVSVAGSSITLNNAYYIRANMLVYDISSPSSIPANDFITSVSGSTIVLNSVGTPNSGDTLLFAGAQKAVTINGDAYEVSGVIPSAAGSDAGTVYFTSNVSAADAANGNTLVPNAHEIWLADGSSWDNIAFNVAGSTTIGGDGANGLQFVGSGVFTFKGSTLAIKNAIGGWSTNNIGKQLIILPTQPNTSDPAIGFSDATGANMWAITDTAGSFLFAAMPALTDSVDAPTYHMGLNVGSDDYFGQYLGGALAVGVATGFTHPFIAINGTPTGNPTFTTGYPAACAINQVGGYLDCYWGGAWHKIAFSGGAG